MRRSAKRALKAIRFGMMIDHEIDSTQRLFEIRRLDIDKRQASAVLVQIVVGNSVDLNVEQANHGQHSPAG